MSLLLTLPYELRQEIFKHALYQEGYTGELQSGRLFTRFIDKVAPLTHVCQSIRNDTLPLWYDRVYLNFTRHSGDRSVNGAWPEDGRFVVPPCFERLTRMMLPTMQWLRAVKVRVNADLFDSRLGWVGVATTTLDVKVDGHRDLLLSINTSSDSLIPNCLHRLHDWAVQRDGMGLEQSPLGRDGMVALMAWAAGRDAKGDRNMSFVVLAEPFTAPAYVIKDGWPRNVVHARSGGEEADVARWIASPEVFDVCAFADWLDAIDT